MGKVILQNGLLYDGSTEEEIKLIEEHMNGKKYSVLSITPGTASIIVYDEEEATN